MELTAILTLPRLHEIAAPLYIMFLLGEFLLVRRGVLKGHFLREDTQASLIIGTGSIVSNMLLVLLGGSLVWTAYENRISTIGFEWWAFLLCFVSTPV